MKQKILDNVKSRLSTVMNSIDNLLKKQLPKKKLKKSSPPSPLNLEDQKLPKETYSYKGSAYKAKGNVNTDAETFNHPRRDVPKGRSH